MYKTDNALNGMRRAYALSGGIMIVKRQADCDVREMEVDVAEREAELDARESLIPLRTDLAALRVATEEIAPVLDHLEGWATMIAITAEPDDDVSATTRETFAEYIGKFDKIIPIKRVKKPQPPAQTTTVASASANAQGTI